MDWITTCLFGVVTILGLWVAFPKPKLLEGKRLLLGRWLLFVFLLGIEIMLIPFILFQMAQAPH